MRKALQLIPYDGIGGVEAAARSMDSLSTPEWSFQVCYLYPKVASRAGRLATFNPWPIVSTAWSIVREKPDVLVVSLWRSAISGILVKLLRPRIRLVTFIHNSVDAHQMDYLATRLAMALSSAIWADSQASLDRRFRKLPDVPISVISFLVRRLSPIDLNSDELPQPSFIFWGRLAAQKNLGRALELFAEIHKRAPQARYLIIGPDGGEGNRLRSVIDALGLAQAVDLVGPKSFEEIAVLANRAAFYLQTSDYEGMAMSVVEAMQLGLVPIVTPVGEIGSYCRAGHNAVIIESTTQTAAAVLRLMNDSEEYFKLRSQAIATWQGRPLYSDSVLAACAALFASTGDGEYIC